METLIWLCRYSQQQSRGWVGLSAAAAMFAWLLVTLRVFCAGELQQGCQKELAKFTSLDVTADGSQSVLPRSTPIFCVARLVPRHSLQGWETLRICTGTEAQRDHRIHTAWLEDKPQYSFQEYLYQCFVELLHTFKRGGENSRSTFISVR